MARVLIPDMSGLARNAVVRSLGRRGDTCEVAWAFSERLRRFGAPLLGRYVRRAHTVASAEQDSAGYARDVLSLCRRRSFDVVMPLGIDSHAALIARAEELSRVTRALLPPAEAFAIGRDKLRTARHAESLGIACPKTFDASNEADVRQIGREVDFPVVIKARGGSGVEGGLRFASNTEELRRGYDDLLANRSRSREGLLIQEFIPGYIHDACAVSAGGEVLQVLTQVRKLMYPIAGGVGAVNFTTHHPRLARTARVLLESLEWAGPAQVEFKLDERDGRLKLIELNPKFWWTLDLAIKAGIDFPGMIRDVLLGRPVPRDRTYPAGVRYKFLCGRGVYAYVQLWRELGWRAVRDPQRYARTHYGFDWRDPAPDLVKCGSTLRALAAGGLAAPGPMLSIDYLNRLDRALPERFTEEGATARHAGANEA